MGSRHSWLPLVTTAALVAPATPDPERPHAQCLRGAAPGRRPRDQRPVFQLEEQKQPQFHHGNVNVEVFICWKAFLSIELDTVLHHEVNYRSVKIYKSRTLHFIPRTLLTPSLKR